MEQDDPWPVEATTSVATRSTRVVIVTSFEAFCNAYPDATGHDRARVEDLFERFGPLHLRVLPGSIRHCHPTQAGGVYHTLAGWTRAVAQKSEDVIAKLRSS
jgi:hypothetical protein